MNTPHNDPGLYHGSRICWCGDTTGHYGAEDCRPLAEPTTCPCGTPDDDNGWHACPDLPSSSYADRLVAALDTSGELVGQQVTTDRHHLTVVGTLDGVVYGTTPTGQLIGVAPQAVTR
jgi:hypothetical protein